jgi:HNH endonuclease
MRRVNPTPPCSIEWLRSEITYRDGHLFWTNPTGLRKRGALGRIRGNRGSKGDFRTRYWSITVLGRTVYAHRLVYYYHTGIWPLFDIDHINNDSMDNRIENLQHLSYKEHSAKTRAQKHVNGHQKEAA